MVLKVQIVYTHVRYWHTFRNMLCKHKLISVRAWLHTNNKQQCTSFLCNTLTYGCLCFTFLSLRCVGRCVRYTCWRTRFLCVRLSGSGCLTPPASLVWRQVRGGHVFTVTSEPPPCDPTHRRGNSHMKPWLLDSVSAAQPWNNSLSLASNILNRLSNLSNDDAPIFRW